MTGSNRPMDDARRPWDRLSRRQVFPLLGAAAAAAFGPALPTFAQGAGGAAAPELQRSQTGTLVGNTGGAFAYYQLSRPTGSPLTLTLAFGPFDGTTARAIGFNVYQNGARLGGAAGRSTGLGDSVNDSAPTATVTPSASGGPVLVQLFNYSPSAVNYTLSSSAAGAAAPSGQGRIVYVGTYTKPSGHADGIYVYRMDQASGALTPLQTVAGVTNPSFLAIDPQQRYLYAVNELQTGGVSAFAIDPASGGLAPLNQQPSNGSFPAHLTVDPSGRYVLVANYGTGNWEVLPIGADGRLGSPTDLEQDTGTGPNLSRQEGPHAHMIVFDAQGRNVVGCDLGADKIMVWHLDTTAGKLIPNSPPWWTLDAGSGPRHIAFHPGGRYAYAIKELDSTITAFAYDAGRGALQALQAVSTLPNGFTGQSACAEIVVHPSGKFVYGSNRGHDSIAAFAIDQGTGLLTLLQHQSTGGKTPRNFNLDPSGTFLYAANQNSDTIVTFRIDGSTGMLTPTGQVTQTPTPVCVLFGRTA